MFLWEEKKKSILEMIAVLFITDVIRRGKKTENGHVKTCFSLDLKVFCPHIEYKPLDHYQSNVLTFFSEVEQHLLKSFFFFFYSFNIYLYIYI